MSNTELTLETVIAQFAHTNTLATNEEKAKAKTAFVQRKEELDTKLTALLARFLPAGKQPILKNKLEKLHMQALKTTAADLDLFNLLFPKLHMSFLQLTSGNQPRWALFDTDLKIDTFSIVYTRSFDFWRQYGHCLDERNKVVLYAKGDQLTITPASFAPLFHSSLLTPIRSYLTEKVLKLTPAQAETFFEHSYTHIPEPFAGPSSQLWTAASSHERRRQEREVTLTFTASFEHFVPASVQQNIEHFRPLFDEMFFVADIPNWTHSSLDIFTSLPAADPLVVGRIGNDYRLIDAFDLTDTESYVKQEFGL